jgi:hypothetical protein
MELNSDQLKEIEELAGLMFLPDKICLVMDIDVKHINTHHFKLAFEKGRLKQEALVRKSIFEHAKNGSSPAQAMAVKMIDDSKLDLA